MISVVVDDCGEVELLLQDVEAARWGGESTMGGENCEGGEAAGGSKIECEATLRRRVEFSARKDGTGCTTGRVSAEAVVEAFKARQAAEAEGEGGDC